MEDATEKSASNDENESASCTDDKEGLWDMALLSKPDSPVPTKSSNEILSELFGAFNAEPPKSPQFLVEGEEDGDGDTDGQKSKKRKKKRKKEKKHKKKKSKRRLSGEQGSSSDDSSDSETDDVRKEKKHKRKKKSRHKNSDMESEELDDQHRNHNKKRPQCSISDSPQPTHNGQTTEEPAGVQSPPHSDMLQVDTKDETSKTPDVFEPPQTESTSDKGKTAHGKITIKDLKFSTVFEATVKEIEEQARVKAERYEEGEISDSSSSHNVSDMSDGPATVQSLDSEAGDTMVLDDKQNDQNHAKRSGSKEKDSSHKKSRHRSRSVEKEKDRDKHSKHKDKERDRDEVKDKDKGKEKDKVKEKDKEKEREKERDKDKRRDREKDKDRHRVGDKSKDRDRNRSRKEKDRGRGDDRDRDRHKRRSHSRSRSGSRSRSSHRRSSSSLSHRRRSRSRERHRSRSRSRSRDRKRSSDHIDKKKLLEIARRNAMNMLQAGILPASIMGRSTTALNMVTTSKPEKNAAKTVDELTEYCKELSKRENLGELSSLSGSDDSDSEKPFHHPFQVKDRPTVISLNIKNAVQLPVKSVQERTIEQSQLRIQFPVSSGQQHRKNEGEWVPVTPQKPHDVPTVEKKLGPPPKPVEPSNANKLPHRDIKDISEEIVDIGALVSQRLSAMRKVHDTETSSHSYNATLSQHMHGWNNALPGQFTGSTGVRLLTPQQLASGAQAWARKDQLQTATPVRSGMGMALLQKMGWKPGEGLGKNKEGCQEPLQLEVKMDRKGLVAAEEVRARKPPPSVMPVVKVPKPPVAIEGKHPVSLLTEYCSKRHFGAPHFQLCMESGPDHKKDFLFKVVVNGLEYKPERASPNKKQAKAEAATVCLKALGVLLT